MSDKLATNPVGVVKCSYWLYETWYQLGFLQVGGGYRAIHIHYNDVIMSAMASQITSLTVVYLIDNSGVYQRKHQSSASLSFVREIHRSPLISPQKRASNAENVSIRWRHHPDRRVKLLSSLQLHTPGESSKGKRSMTSSRCSPGQEKGFDGLCMVNWKSGDDDFHNSG